MPPTRTCSSNPSTTACCPASASTGKNYFYVNALKKLKDFEWPMRWSRTRTPNIKASFCCPPNTVRTIAEMHNYVYSLSKDALWVNLYAASELSTGWLDGSRVKLKQETDYPWNGAVKLTMVEAPARPIAVRLRVPGWLHAGAAKLRVNGQPVDAKLAPGSYAEVKRTWRAGDVIDLAMDFSPVLLEANPLVEETLNQVAVKFGPLVYCLESNDLPEGVRLADVMLALDRTARALTPQPQKIGPANLVALRAPALAALRPAWGKSELYREHARAPMRDVSVSFVPYYAWGNRGDTEMSVWLPAR